MQKLYISYLLKYTVRKGKVPQISGSFVFLPWWKQMRQLQIAENLKTA